MVPFLGIYLSCAMVFGNAAEQPHPGSDRPRPPRLSAISLAGDPQKYSGREIMLSGWLGVEMEKGRVTYMYIFPTPDHLLATDFPSSISLDPKSFQAALHAYAPRFSMLRLQGAYALVTGIFRGSNLQSAGNVGLGDGSVQQVTSVTFKKQIAAALEGPGGQTRLVY